jgi:hypothetical protein
MQAASLLKESKMRQVWIIGLTMLVTASVTAITMSAFHGSAGNRMPGYAPATVDVMGMMKGARNLPNENFDAH